MQSRPYLIIPKLIVQPTWGGDYIAKMKNWQDLTFLKDKKIGQSYELFSGTKLAVNINDTSDPKFIPQLGNPDTDEVDTNNFSLTKDVDYIDVPDSGNLLIKINHSKGNSFQIHIKRGQTDPRWKPKAESWYYLEDGKLSFGIKKGIDINEYKNACVKINDYMTNLSKKIKSGEISLEGVRDEAKKYIQTENPWQFVNVYESKKYEVIDPSLGGIHHSWEEDDENYPLGNVVYEIQEDVMDPVSTLRAFDQGKIKDGGSIRELNIDDYFKYLDLDETHNDVNLGDHSKLKNSIYSMDVLEIKDQTMQNINNKFHHLLVRDGAVEIVSPATTLKIGKGHSCYIPKSLENYIIRPLLDKSVVLKTYLT